MNSHSTTGGPGGLAISTGQYTVDHSAIAGNISDDTDGAIGGWDFGVLGAASGFGTATGAINHSLVLVPTDDAIAVMTVGTGNISGADAQLGALADNGGFTLAHLPLEGSPLMNAGDGALSGSPQPTSAV